MASQTIARIVLTFFFLWRSFWATISGNREMESEIVFFVLYCLYLSSIHEKANCIAIFWTGRPHSLGSCHFRGVWTTCLPHKGGGVPLSILPKNTSELAGLFSTTSLNAERQAGKLWIPFFKVFWYDSTRGMNPRSTDCEADALTTTLSRRLISKKKSSPLSTRPVMTPTT